MTSLSILAILLGLAAALPQAYGLAKPQPYAGALQRFPRSIPWGIALMLLATAWFCWNLSQESIADLAVYKNVLYLLFVAVGIGSCVFVQDFLAVRGLAVVLLLLAKLMVDMGRPALPHNHWVLIIQMWAYVLVVLGMWLTISPWRLRNWLDWLAGSPQRLKTGCSLAVAFGLFVVAVAVLRF
jgi:hypothetical protein